MTFLDTPMAQVLDVTPTDETSAPPPVFTVRTRAGVILSTHDNLSSALDAHKVKGAYHVVRERDQAPLTPPWSKANAHVPEGVTIDPIDVEAA